ncbi:hypothetical protein Hanom_Chr08g00742801 [Helianthus anomalus]
MDSVGQSVSLSASPRCFHHRLGCDNSCVELSAKLSDFQSKYDVTFIYNQNLIVDLSKCTETNMFHKIMKRILRR